MLFFLFYISGLAASTIKNEKLVLFTNTIKVSLIDEESEIQSITINSLKACFKHPRHSNKRVVRVPILTEQELPAQEHKDEWYKHHQIPPNAYDITIKLTPFVPTDSSTMELHVICYVQIEYYEYKIPYTSAASSQWVPLHFPKHPYAVPISYLYYGIEAEIMINDKKTTLTCEDAPYTFQQSRDEL